MAFFYAITTVIILLLAPIFMGADVYFDLVRNIAVINVKLFGVNLLKIRFRQEKNDLYFSVGKGKEKEIKAGKGGGFPFFKAVKIRKMKIVMKFGAIDAATTALITAALNRINTQKLSVICLPDYTGNMTMTAKITAFTYPLLGVFYGFRKIKVDV